MHKFADEKEMNRLEMLKKKAAKMASGALDDDDKTIGELIREMNVPKKEEGAASDTGTEAAFFQEPEQDLHIDKNSETDDLKRRTVVEEAERGAAKENVDADHEKLHFEELIWALRKFMSSLHERGIKKLNPLLPEGEEGIITQNVNQMEKLLDRNDPNPADLNIQIVNITSSLNKIGTVRQKHGIVEDTENLIMIESNLHSVEEGCHTALIRSVKDGSAGSKTLNASVGKLFDVAQKKKIFVAGLVASFDKFRRR